MPYPASWPDAWRPCATRREGAALAMLAWLCLGFIGVALLQATLGSTSWALLAVAALAVLAALPLLVLSTPPQALLVTLLAYTLCAFYLTLGLTQHFAMDARTAFAGFKNLLLLTVLVWWALGPGGTASPWRPMEWLFALFLVALVWVETPMLAPRLGYFLNSFLPLLLCFLALRRLPEGGAYRPRQGSALLVITLAFLATAPLGWIISHHLIDSEVLIAQQAAKGYGHIEGYPRNWWTYLQGELYLRLSGTAEDPVLYGYFAAFLGYLWLARGGLVWVGLLSLVVLASMVKGAMLLMASGLAFWWLFQGARPLARLHGILGALLMLLLIAFYVWASGVSETSADVHVLGLWLPFQQVLVGEVGAWQAWFGHGLGSSGNLYKASLGGALSNLEWLRGGAESGFGLVFYQTGAVGLALLLWLVYRGTRHLKAPAARGLWVIYWANAAVQENLINLNYLTLLLAALALLEAWHGKEGTLHEDRHH